MSQKNIAVDLVGACPVCKLQYHGRVHNCPGEISPQHQSILIGAQFLDEMPSEEVHPYGQRLEDGFALLGSGGWEGPVELGND